MTPFLRDGTAWISRIRARGAIALVMALASFATSSAAERRTTVAIVGDAFHVNGRPTFEGRVWKGRKVEGLLPNSRMVQGIFDDRNPETRPRFAYPDTGVWDAERNTREFIAAMPEWRRHGLLAFTICLQGGSPEGYSKDQPWHNSAIEADGSLRPADMARLARILDRADELGMVVILGLFYFGQDQRLADEAAVVRAVDEAAAWVLAGGWRNVMIEVANECNVRYDHAILRPGRVHELIERVKAKAVDGRRLLAGVSYGGGTIPGENVVRASDFLLIHGNGVADPEKIAAMVRRTRQVPGYTPKPILFNEDDHFDFDRPSNNFLAALSEYASWGYFDPGELGPDGRRLANYVDGYQTVPVNWSINTPRKRAFFNLLAEVVGAEPDAAAGAKPTPVKLILDTDMSGDCDDAGAMALLLALADRGECELLAIPVNRADRTKASAAAVDAIATYYGRPDIPIGTDKVGPTALQRTSAYAPALRDGFRNDVGPDDRAPDALDVYRNALSSQPDGSVTICSVGALSNLAELLRREPALVRAKVRRLVVMAGEFPPSKKPETNLFTHLEASRYVADRWPGEVVWHGFEVGEALFTGSRLKETPTSNPVRRAYELKPYGKRPAIEGGQPSYDQAAALFAVRGPRPEFWRVVSGGRVRVDEAGLTHWEPDPNGRHSYVKIAGEPARLAETIEALMIAPPRRPTP